MYFELSIIYCLYLWLPIASATVNLAQVVSSNENLQEQSTNADTDVNNVNVINALEAAPVRIASLACNDRGLTIAV